MTEEENTFSLIEYMLTKIKCPIPLAMLRLMISGWFSLKMEYSTGLNAFVTSAIASIAYPRKREPGPPS